MARSGRSAVVGKHELLMVKWTLAGQQEGSCALEIKGHELAVFRDCSDMSNAEVPIRIPKHIADDCANGCRLRWAFSSYDGLGSAQDDVVLYFRELGKDSQDYSVEGPGVALLEVISEDVAVAEPSDEQILRGFEHVLSAGESVEGLANVETVEEIQIPEIGFVETVEETVEQIENTQDLALVESIEQVVDGGETVEDMNDLQNPAFVETIEQATDIGETVEEIPNSSASIPNLVDIEPPFAEPSDEDILRGFEGSAGLAELSSPESCGNQSDGTILCFPSDCCGSFVRCKDGQPSKVQETHSGVKCFKGDFIPASEHPCKNFSCSS